MHDAIRLGYLALSMIGVWLVIDNPQMRLIDQSAIGVIAAIAFCRGIKGIF